jgi:hypothetical protein
MPAATRWRTPGRRQWSGRALLVEAVSRRAATTTGRQADEEDEQLDCEATADRAPSIREGRRENASVSPTRSARRACADEPAAAHPDTARASLLEDLQCPPVEGRRNLGYRGRVDVGLDRAHLVVHPSGPRTTGRTCRIHHSPNDFGSRPTPASPGRTQGFSEATSMPHASNERMDCLNAFSPELDFRLGNANACPGHKP